LKKAQGKMIKKKKIKSRRMRWNGHEVRMEEMRNGYILVRKPEGRNLVQRLCS
jgi:hypothetical protein